MNICDDIFKKTKINYDKILSYGFTKEKEIYKYSKLFLDNQFEALITIKNDKVFLKVIDKTFDEEYTNIYIENNSLGFANQVKEECRNILLDIKNNCFDTLDFIGEQANRVSSYIKNKYGSLPEFLWEKYSDFGVFRSNKNKKWFAIIMNISKTKIDFEDREVEVLNLKVDNPLDYLDKKGFYKAYHMDKKSWITVLLDDTLTDSEVFSLIDTSHNIINKVEKWIIPANPKYFDVMTYFKNNKIIEWKQTTNINVSDIVYFYFSEPFKKLMFKCVVQEKDIPYEYRSKNVKMDKVMRLEVVEDISSFDYNFEYLNKNGIKMIRGPRRINDLIVK